MIQLEEGPLYSFENMLENDRPGNRIDILQSSNFSQMDSLQVLTSPSTLFD
jgi:hypothetical protein